MKPNLIHSGQAQKDEEPTKRISKWKKLKECARINHAHIVVVDGLRFPRFGACYLLQLIHSLS